MCFFFHAKLTPSTLHLLHVVAGFGARLDEHDVQLFGLAFALLGGHLPFVGQIRFVADQHDDDVGAAFGAHIVDPFGRLMV